MLQGSFNTRAVRALSGKPWLYRSAELDDITAADEQLLTSDGVTQIIDLRSRQERASSPHSITTNILPLYGEENVPPLANGILETYQNLLDHSGPMFAEIANLVAEEPGLSLIHCRVGKDRTGLSIALLMAAAGASRSAIVSDYVLSEPEVRRARQEDITAQLAQTNLDAAAIERALALHLTSPADVLETILDGLQQSHGGSANYLSSHGMTSEALHTLRSSYAGEDNITIERIA